MHRASSNLTRYASAILGAAIVLGVSPVSPLFVSVLRAQSIISGDIAGTVTDPSGASVTNAQVVVKNTATGATKQLTTNSHGNYRASLLQPGDYTVTVSASGFSDTVVHAAVSNGQVATSDVKLGVGSSNTSVEVSASSGLMQTEQAEVSTSFDMKQIQNMPNPGSDLTYVAQIAPGSVQNNGAGYGNFSTFGLPATANLFTVDGANENDPFLNLNNSGATNILLGSNDIEQATVINNGYQGQYGGLGAANINYVTRSGSNKYHGDLKYYWNGSSMNANDWLLNHTATPKPFDNVNQWAADIGGPVIKDKTFFFVNTEGLRILLPTNTQVLVPSAAYQNAIINGDGTAVHPGLVNRNPAAIPFYNKVFSLYNNAPGVANAQPTDTPGVNSFRSTAPNLTTEWLMTARFDQQFGQNDHLFIHFRTDHGAQATYTDPLNPAFNGQSIQPQYEGQLNETHAFSPTLTNQFIAAGSWYSAVFSEPNRATALNLLPESIAFQGLFTDAGHDLDSFPQGRNVSQYQIVDDVTKVLGNHSIKFGVSYKRNDVTDYGPQQTVAPAITGETDTDFGLGNATAFQQNFPVRQTEPIALYALDGYLQDEWKASPSLTLTAALRVEHNSNPVCQTNCFSNLTNGVASLDGNLDEPYNSKIQSAQHQLFPNFDQVSWQPRVGFNFAPASLHGNTVVRGGFGIFADSFPGTVAEYMFKNVPNIGSYSVFGLGIAPGTPGSATGAAAASNEAFASAFPQGGTFNSVSADVAQTAGVAFTPPSFTLTNPRIHYPTYYEYNLAVQQLIAKNTTLTINYVGNHGSQEPIQNPGANTYVPQGDPYLAATNFRSTLPTVAPDGSFSTVTQIASGATSNDNSLAVSLQHSSKYLSVQANYTWQHALDEISNGGFLQYTFDSNTSAVSQLDPHNLRGQYGNSDYDIRNNFTLAYVLTVPKFGGPRVLTDGWQLSGTVFAHSGSPYSITDSSTTSDLSAYNYGVSQAPFYNSVLATQVGRAPKSCDAKAAVDTPCLGTAPITATSDSGAVTATPGSEFTFAQGFSTQRRNSFVGPNYFDTDLTVYKSFSLQRFETAKLRLGAQFINLFNHANFDQPVSDIGSPVFGTTQLTVGAPTSIFGSFLGGDASPRQIQLTARFEF